jgi:hypothetical protein
MRIARPVPFALVLAAGCALPAAPPSSSPEEWLPAEAGRTWIFERRRNGEVSRAHFRLEGPAGTDVPALALVIENPRTGAVQRARLVQEGGAVTIHSPSGRMDLLRPPLEPGRRWSWSDGGRRNDATVVGIETRDVAGRPTPCLHVRYETAGAGTADYWFARGIGWIRIESASPGAARDVCELAVP